MSKILKRLSVLICGCLVAVCALSTFVSNKEIISTPIRDVELVKQNVEMNSNFEKFDSYDLEFNDGKVDFVGYDSIKLSDLYELDLLSDETVDNEVLTKYSCTYDYENGIISLSVSLINGEENSIIDTIYGVIIMDKESNYDVAFDCDGEILLLSELEEAGMIDNCGFFSKLKKVWNTTAGKIGTIATVATCAVVGVVCAVVPGGQLVTAVCIGVAVGAIGGAVTAGVATYLEDGAIDWEAVLCYSTAGAIVGGVTSAASFKITSYFMNASKMKSLLKQSDKNPTSKDTYIGKYIKGNSNSYETVAKTKGGNYFQLDNWDDLVAEYGDDAMRELNKNFITTKVNAGNTIYSTTNPSSATGAFANEIQWIKDIAGNNWQQIGESLWKLIR